MPRFLIMKELSIFVDESGNFGSYNKGSHYYIFSLVFHNQQNDISSYITSLNRELDSINYGSHYFHAGPIIRKENEYKTLDVATRRRIFNKMSFFANHIDYKYIVVTVNKKYINDELQLIAELSTQLGRFIRQNSSYFDSFDLIKVYYDNGQKQLSRILVSVLGALLENVEFKKVKPQDYNLFQVADFVSTLALTDIKYKDKTLSSTELYFFGNYRSFYRNYYKPIAKKKI